MPSEQKTKKKKVKRKLKIKNILLLLLILFLIGMLFSYITTIGIKNIYIIGTEILPDKTIIKDAKLDTYPSFLLTKSEDIKKELLKNDYIKDVKITKHYKFKVYLEIEENKILAKKQSDNNLILESTKEVEDIYKSKDVPILINDITDIKDDFCKYFSQVDNTILTKISQIEYSPNNVDNMRFLLYMNDGNYVYVTLTKIDKLNKYNSIKDQLGEHEGIVYLDSGDYFEIKEKESD